jgi:hypothetical protein
VLAEPEVSTLEVHFSHAYKIKGKGKVVPVL